MYYLVATVGLNFVIHDNTLIILLLAMPFDLSAGLYQYSTRVVFNGTDDADEV